MDIFDNLITNILLKTAEKYAVQTIIVILLVIFLLVRIYL